MRFGCCAGVDKIQAIQDAGYDYVELTVGTVMPESPESEYAPVRDKIKSFKIKPEAWNVLLPGGIKVTGPEVDLYRVERYLRTAFARIADLGGKVVVFGSGGARKVPDDFPVDEARKQILEFLAVLGNVAGENGITIAIEPLNKKETNIINSVAEGMEYVEAINHPNIKCLADYYHIDEENEPLSDVTDAGSDIVHVHTADTGRYSPGIHEYGPKELIDSFEGKPAYDHIAFFKTLRGIDYDARISVEGRWSNFDTDVKKALDYLKDQWEKSS